LSPGGSLRRWIGEANCPQLIDVLDELEDWWHETGQHLHQVED
jgi:hypothetical protein